MRPNSLIESMKAQSASGQQDQTQPAAEPGQAPAQEPKTIH
jgi:hypothetical protein